MANLSKFREELESLINGQSMEGGSNTPDFLLAMFLGDCLKAFDKAVRMRDEWYLNGQRMTPAQTPSEQAEWLEKAYGKGVKS